MTGLETWLPLVASAITVIALWGRASEKLTRIEKTLERIEAREDERLVRERTLEARISTLEQAFRDGMRAIIGATETLADHSEAIAWLKGKRPSDPAQPQRSSK